MIVTRIIYTRDHVRLTNDTEALALTYGAWTAFLQHRGTLSIPFHVDFVVGTTTFNPRCKPDDTPVVITDAQALQ